MPDNEKALGLTALSTVRDWVKSLIPSLATASTPGIVQPDGSTVTVNNGVLSAVGGGGGGVQTTWYGYCSTAEATAEKAVECTGFTLVKGAVITIHFSKSNTADVPTLNINSTGAKIIQLGTANVSATNPLKWTYGEDLTFIYDGVRFRFITAQAAGRGSSINGGGGWYGYCSTVADTAIKEVSITSYRPMNGDVLNINFLKGNTASLLYLSVNGESELQVYKGTSPVSPSNPLTWGDGEMVSFCRAGYNYYYIGRSELKSGVEISAKIVTLNASNWSNNSQTVTVEGVTADNTVVVSYAPESKAVYTAADIYCSAQGADELTFACANAPNADVTVNVMIYDVEAEVQTVQYEIHNSATGNVSVQESAAENESVTVTATGSTYYSISVRKNSSSGTVIAQTSDYVTSGATFTFTMPAEPVWITVAAKPR